MQDYAQGFFGSLGAKVRFPVAVPGEGEKDSPYDRITRRMSELATDSERETPARSVFRH